MIHPEPFEYLQLLKLDIFRDTKFRQQNVWAQSLIARSFRHQKLSSPLIFYVRAPLKMAQWSRFPNPASTDKVYTVWSQTSLPCSLIFKYFTTFLKGTRTTLPNLSVHKLNPMAGIAQNGQKRIIFIVVCQVRRKIRD